MSLANPEARRGLRSVVQAIVALLVIGLVFWLVHLLRKDPPSLIEIARYSLAIVALGTLGTLGYIMENTVRAFKIKLGPSGLDFTADAEQAAQTVADAAQERADEVTADPPDRRG